VLASASDVPLNQVYKVMRFYSFWRSTTSFHRIVTMISRVDLCDSFVDTEPEGIFKQRIFIQYLWRNARQFEKDRVAREFDPSRQKLLKYVKRNQE
jgi:sugar-specific transcriptional regulator TrmB